MRSVALSKHLSHAAVASSNGSSRRFAIDPSIAFCCSWYRHYAASVADEEAESVTFPRYREEPGFSNGLNWALAGRGVIVKDKAFHNLEFLELRKHDAAKVESLSHIPLYVRGNAVGGASKISRAQFAKLLKQVTSHISSISNVFVQDGAVASAAKSDAKVRFISDSSSAVLSLSNFLQGTPNRAISHDSCPLTVYIASTISPSISKALGFGTQVSTGFAAADIERSSLILCDDTIRTCPDLHQALVSMDAGVVLSLDGVAPFFKTRDPASNLLKKPASVIIASSDSTGVIPLVSKLSPGQAAYHFLVGYQDGKFVPAYSKGPSPVDPVSLAKAFLSQLKYNEIPSFLINVNSGGKHITGKEIIKLATATLFNNLPENKPGPADANVRDLKRKFKSFLSSRFPELPEEFSF